jgi:hypothetical protein
VFGSRARVFSQQRESKPREQTVLALPEQIMWQVEHSLRSYEQDDEWLLPSYDSEFRGRP